MESTQKAQRSSQFASTQRVAQSRFSTKSREQGAITGMINSPVLIAQRKLQQSIDYSPRQLKQSKRFADEPGQPLRRMGKDGALDVTLNGHASQNVSVQYKTNQASQINPSSHGKFKPTIQPKRGIPVNDDMGLEHEADVMGTKAMQMMHGNSGVVNNHADALAQQSLVTSIKQNPPMIHLNSSVNLRQDHAPIQAVKFSRWMSTFYYNTDESTLLEKEKRINEFYASMAKYAPRFPAITQIGTRLGQLKNAVLDDNQIKAIGKEFDQMQIQLDDISTKIAVVGVKGGEELMEPFGTNPAESLTVRIIQIMLDAIAMIPAVFKSDSNREAIKQAIHPDIDTAGLRNENLGESDVSFAKFRSNQILKNLWTVEERILGDWTQLQGTFGLVGGLKSVELTGSDLHKGGQQVMIITAAGGQKVVYKPRSVAPDAALLDPKNGAFAALNKLGGELPTMKFMASKKKGGSYAEFISQKKLKTVEEIREYYRKFGQLVVASKLFGVNDLHYENIMAAGQGPTIIDAETSFLMNVMMARDFQHNELQTGIFQHVSEIDSKLSNNAFYTQAEQDEWNLPGQDQSGGWDKFIGEKRDADVKAGGPYVVDMTKGINEMLSILKRRHQEAVGITLRTMEELDDIRVVPLKTSIFKILMQSYRDWQRVQNEQQLKNTAQNCMEQVADKLQEKGYMLHKKTIILPRIIEDFENGDIPVLHYSTPKNQLTWNGRVVGKRRDKGGVKKVVGDNVKWIVKQTANGILESLRG